MSIPEQIQALIEAKFDELMLSLQAGQIPVKLTKAVKIEDSKIESPTYQLNISKSKLIEIYNEIPILLQAYAIPVDWTIDSYQHPSSPPLLLHAVASSNYWIIPTLIINRTIYWLVPNPLRQIRLDKLKHLSYLFEYSQNNPTDINSEFQLIEPGKISYYFETGLVKWKLEQPGKLAVTNRANAKYDPAQPIEALQQQMMHQAAIIQQLQQKFDAGLTKWTLDRSADLTASNEIAKDEAAKIIEDLQKQIVQQAATIQQLQEQVSQKTTTIQQLQPLIRIPSNYLEQKKHGQNYEDTLNTSPELEQKKQAVPNQWQNLIDDYSRLGVTFSGYYLVIEVQLTNYETMWARSGTIPILSPSKSGRFWLIEINGYSLLVPNPKQRYNKYIIDELESLFLFEDLYYGEYKRIFLISPAVLSYVGSGEVTSWQLQEKGNISFRSAWIDEYNQNSRSFYTKYVKAEVLEEGQNIERRRRGEISTVNLSVAPQRTGGYWVFDRDNQLMLVPSSEVRINKFNLYAIDAMFDYSDFNSNYRQIRLIDPAIVESNAARGYQLIRRGRIEFE